MRDLRKMIGSMGAGVRSKTVLLRQLPVIAEVEQMMYTPAGAWSDGFEATCDAASLSLFGVTAKDVNPPEPHPDNFGSGDRRLRSIFEEDARLSYEKALDAWLDWQAVIQGYEREADTQGVVRYWLGMGIDVGDGSGSELRCFRFFSRQLIAARRSLLPGARLTLDGSGRRRPQSTEEWEAALSAEAARFRPSR